MRTTLFTNSFLLFVLMMQLTPVVLASDDSLMCREETLTQDIGDTVRRKLSNHDAQLAKKSAVGELAKRNKGVVMETALAVRKEQRAFCDSFATFESDLNNYLDRQKKEDRDVRWECEPAVQVEKAKFTVEKFQRWIYLLKTKHEEFRVRLKREHEASIEDIKKVYFFSDVQSDSKAKAAVNSLVIELNQAYATQEIKKVGGDLFGATGPIFGTWHSEIERLERLIRNQEIARSEAQLNMKSCPIP